jgi:hypothetical protein
MLKLEEVKMLKLEEVIGNQLEADGRVLAEKVAEYVFTCFQSRDRLSPWIQWCIKVIYKG